MSEDSKTPKAKVEVGTEATSKELTKSTEAPQEGADAEQSGVKAARQAVTSWVSRTFPGHEKAFWGGVAGLLVALVLFWIGLFRTVVIVLLVCIGVAAGQVAEGDPKLIRALQKFFSGIDK